MQTKTIRHNTSIPAIEGIRDRLALAFADEAGRKQLLVYLLVLACTAVFLAHAPSLSARGRFLDDEQYVGKNPLVNTPSWRSVRRFFSEVWQPSTVSGYYQPLTMTSLMVDRFLAGPQGSIRAYHRTSLWLHVANTALLGVFLYRLFGQPLIAAGVALLFGLHPISVESVCWISERKTVLATFFAVLSLISYVRFSRCGRLRHYVVCLIMYALALLSKPITVPLPAMMLLMDYWPLDRLTRRSVLEKLPLFVVGGVFAVITYVSQSRTAPVYVPGDYSPFHVPLILGHNIVFYLYKFLWPVRLSAYYEFPSPMTLWHPMVLTGVVGTCVLIALLIVSRRRTRALLAGWLIFFVMILPAMGIISVTPTIAANRYAYLPSIGFLMVLAAFLVWLSRANRPLLAFALVVMMAGLEAGPMRHYLVQWRETVTLHEYMLSIAPDSPGIHANLGVELGNAGQTKRAFEHLRRSLSLDSDNYRTRYNFAVILEKSRETEDEAIEQYQKVIDIRCPLALTSRLNLGNVFLRRGQLDEAIAHYREAVKMNPAFVHGHCNLGKTLVIAGQASEGIAHLREAVRLKPAFFLATKDLAWFLATHPNEAIRDANEALGYAQQLVEMTHGRDVTALDTLAAAYACDGQYGKALETAQKALTMAGRLGDDQLIADVEERVRLYGMSLPYWEAPRVQLDRLIAERAKWERAADGTAETPEDAVATQDATIDVQSQ